MSHCQQKIIVFSYMSYCQQKIIVFSYMSYCQQKIIVFPYMSYFQEKIIVFSHMSYCQQKIISTIIDNYSEHQCTRCYEMLYFYFIIHVFSLSRQMVRLWPVMECLIQYSIVKQYHTLMDNSVTLQTSYVCLSAILPLSSHLRKTLKYFLNLMQQTPISHSSDAIE